VMFEDSPNSYDAWNIETYHLEKRRNVGTVTQSRVEQKGGLLGSVKFVSRLSKTSTITQTISLQADSCRLDFDCEVDWHESNTMLKVEFPLDLHSDHATYEIQFGHLRRPTHFNTSWDIARFEVSAQRWADLSEPTFGVALLNDSKYGYACHGHVMRLSLLRSPSWPDAKADIGRHWFRYALYPHAGSPQMGGVVRAAMAFNQPLTVQASARAPEVQSFFAISNPDIIIDTIKKAEDSDALIVRLFESSGSRQRGRLTSIIPVVKAHIVNLLEDETGKSAWIRSYKLTLER
jgi:alpha-mannosidase